MELKLVRTWSNDNETLGIMSVDNTEICFILEDQHQVTKVYGETRIPTGKYLIRLRDYNSSMHEKYRGRFPDFHRGMLEIKGVPDFTNVYIHIGNDDNDTLGCLLTGRKAIIKNGKITLENSTDAYKELYKKVVDAAKNNNLTLQII